MIRTSLMAITMGAWLAVALSASLADEKTSSVRPLFNGKDLTGWTTYLDPRVKNADPKRVWTIENGEIHCVGKPHGYLLTEKEYGDCRLRVQWKWPEKPGNSGVFVFVSGPDKIWPKGVECQLAAGRAGDFWLVDGFKMKIDSARDPNTERHFARIGDTFVKPELPGEQPKAKKPKYNIIGKQVEKAVGEWNQYDITLKGDTIDVVVNGQHVNVGAQAETTKGKILLQSEGAPVVFRNIEIIPLK